mmetsp:Transcript_11920/g.12967  ORF Transcript_11920/g.12967 Transcript_11920/m.12967 type:complete len:88 (+) Transcript_11920:91-354(+)|eukprot:Skav210544  [mRNA]  locus=scaffold3117:40950:41213:- [translate_table: standard]
MGNCPRCAGTGTIYTRDMWTADAHHRAVTETCPFCGGTGRVKEQEPVHDAAWSHQRDRIEQNQAAIYQDPPSIKLETPAPEPGCVLS